MADAFDDNGVPLFTAPERDTSDEEDDWIYEPTDINTSRIEVPKLNSNGETDYIWTKLIFTPENGFPSQLADDIIVSLEEALIKRPDAYADGRRFKIMCKVGVSFMNNTRELIHYTISLGEINSDELEDSSTMTIYLEEAWESIYFGDRDYEENTNIEYAYIQYLPIPAGGCNTCKKERKEQHKEFKLINNVSRNNNCFFACIKGHIGHRGLNPSLQKKLCNELRKPYGINQNEPIDITAAQDFLTKSNIDIEIVVDIDQIKNIEGKCILLKGEHYYNVEKKNKCQMCGQYYMKKHSLTTCLSKRKYTDWNAHKKRFAEPKSLDKWKGYDNHSEVAHYDIESWGDKEFANVGGLQRPFIVGYTKGDFYINFKGKDCMSQLYKWLWDNEFQPNKDNKDYTLYINAYNGSGYDHFFLFAEEYTRQYHREEGNILFNNGAIISGCLFGDERFKVIDLYKHITGSLEKNLKQNDCQYAKGKIDYDLFREWDKTKKELREEVEIYLEADVKGLQELYIIVNKQVFADTGKNICETLTLSQNAYETWKDRLMDLVYIPDETKYNDFCQAKYGGRVYGNKKRFISKQLEMIEKAVERGEGKEIYDSITDYCVDCDVVSLYPECFKYLYPIGEPIFYKGMLPVQDKMGIHLIKYSPPKTLLYPVLARHEEKALKWDLEDNEGWYCSVDIENAVRMGYKIEYIRGYYWKESKPILKEYVDKFWQNKENATKGTTAYTTAKLFLNALYGKMLQKAIFNKTELFKSYAAMTKRFAGNKVNEIIDIGEDRYMMDYEPRVREKRNMKITKPTQNGVFILAYSRRVMLDYYLQLNPENKMSCMYHYGDTDSLQVHIDMAKHLKWSPELGGMSDDLDDDGAKIIEAYWTSPKCYALKYITPNGEINICKKTKGLSQANKVNRNIEFKDYVDMDKGECKDFTTDLQFKKIGLKLNSSQKQAGFTQFGVSKRKNVKKTINLTKWTGREFFCGNHSFPKGFDIKGESHIPKYNKDYKYPEYK